MTLLMLWTNKAADATAINIASDSRLSFGSIIWDHATKLHRIHPTQMWLGYCGDSFTGLSAIACATAVISSSKHLSKSSGSDKPTITARVAAIRTHLAGALEYLPRDWRPTATTLLFADYDQRKGR
ncbi:hypothetical protein, partial [Alkalilimnicola ehrlichii]|uniref:hypothetical protein n=1 Tax=Alkalilimnicola ehrlichii TaxID=351052 RepID=UPI001C6DEBAC